MINIKKLRAGDMVEFSNGSIEMVIVTKTTFIHSHFYCIIQKFIHTRNFFGTQTCKFYEHEYNNILKIFRKHDSIDRMWR